MGVIPVLLITHLITAHPGLPTNARRPILCESCHLTSSISLWLLTSKRWWDDARALFVYCTPVQRIHSRFSLEGLEMDMDRPRPPGLGAK